MKFKNKYRIETTRLKGWNYGSSGYYFVTICTKDREYYLGEIVNGEIQLSEIGTVVNKCWLEIPKHYSFVDLDEYTIMPNHVHGIIVINNDNIVETQDFASLRNNQDFASLRNNQDFASLRNNQDFASLRIRNNQWQQNKFGPQSRNLASIIRGFKIGVKKYATINNINFHWQSRFYDHIIQSEKELCKIRQYIVDNPARWDLDRNNPENLYI